jgi:hypothetical protein
MQPKLKTQANLKRIESEKRFKKVTKLEYSKPKHKNSFIITED